MASKSLPPVGKPHGENRYIMGGYVLGEGTYGVVVKATDKVTKRTVAVKKFRKEIYEEGSRVTASNVTDLREIQLLNELHHPNIVQLLDVFPYKNTHHLVFECMETNLAAVIHNPNINLSPADYKSYMQMTLTGLAACHKKGILHRDLKPSNLLLGSNGQLKLADFGLASHFRTSNEQFSPREVCTQGYRAPELLFGSKRYGPGVDVWAAACIFAELILRRRFFRGKTEIGQLREISEVFGTPSEALWPGMTNLPNYVKFEYCPPQSFPKLFPQASADCLDLLQQMFTYDPKQRITAQQALEHKYFRTAPTPTPAHMLPRQVKLKLPVAQPAVPRENLSPEDGEITTSPPPKKQRVQQFNEVTRPAAVDIRPAVEAAIRDVHAKQGLHGGLQPCSDLLGKAIEDAGTANKTTGKVTIQDAHTQRQQAHQKAPQKNRQKSREEYYKSLDATRSALRARQRRNTEYHVTSIISKASSGSQQQKRSGEVPHDGHREARVIPPEELKKTRYELGMKKHKYTDDGDCENYSKEKIVQEKRYELGMKKHKYTDDGDCKNYSKEKIVQEKRYELGMKKHKYTDDEGDCKNYSKEKIVHEMDMSPPSPYDLVDYEVEEVLNARIWRGKLEYAVLWKGYSIDESTWEPAENLHNAQEKVSAFHRRKSIQAEGMWNILRRLNPGFEYPPQPQ